MHLQVTFSRSKMSSQDEGDYMDVRVSFYLFSLYVLNKGILLLLINNFIFAMCCLPLVIFFIFGW